MATRTRSRNRTHQSNEALQESWKAFLTAVQRFLVALVTYLWTTGLLQQFLRQMTARFRPKTA